MTIKERLSAPIGGGKKARKPARRSLPVKRSLNLATTGEKPINVMVALPALVLILVGAVLIGKFAVLDRLAEVARAEAQLNTMQQELDAKYEELKQFGELTDEYAHYTYSGMTQEEMARTDRVAVLDLIQRVVLPQAWVTSWSVKSNILTLDITRGNLQEINLMSQQLIAEPLVNFCTITTAATTNQSSTETSQGEVSGQIVIYLNSVEDDTGDTAAAAETASATGADAVISKTTDTVNALANAKAQTEQTVEEELNP